jgi:MFS family permease
MATFQPADNLRSRTFLGLLVSQFLAAFNDQAIHASAMFFAINTEVMTETQAISLMPILFYAPWALFCTAAGFLADRFSKQFSLVFWKVAEVAITLTALFGFWLGRQEGHQVSGAWVVLACVFLMGMHSAFFVPAKYGAMPEILTSRMLSRGNGLLESLSFLAVILGTVVGGELSSLYRGQEYMIGVFLTSLAVLGALASLLIRRMPAASPTRPFPPYVYKPLLENIRVLVRSRPLAVAVVGIAFFTFLVAFMRSTVYMHGQSQVPLWSEAYTSRVVGMVALGIGLGSPLVGFLSGGKVELGLVPVGALGMVLATSVAALALSHVPTLLVCIVLIGFFTGFYLVPLFTLLQHRAPKASKGDSIATSNFINVTGAIAASVVFFAMDYTARKTGLAPALQKGEKEARGPLVEREYLKGHAHKVVVGEQVFEAEEKTPPYRYLRISRRAKEGDEVVLRTYSDGPVTWYRVQLADRPEHPVYNKSGMPRLLFLSAGALTLLTVLLLWRQLPDLFLRTWLWARSLRRYRIEAAGMNHVPANGPAILVTDAPGAEGCLRVLSATDRTTHFLLVQGPDGPPPTSRHQLAVVGAETSPAVWEEVTRKARTALEDGEVIGVTLREAPAQVDRLLVDLAGLAPLVPVHYAAVPQEKAGPRRVFILGGDALSAGSSPEAARGPALKDAGAPVDNLLPGSGLPEAVRGRLQHLRDRFEQVFKSGVPLGQAFGEGH